MAAFRARDISTLAPSTSWTGGRGRGRASLRGSRGGRSDRGGRGGWRQPDGPPIPDLSRNPLGQLLCTVSSSDLQTNGEDFAGTAAIADLKYVSSYNWVNSETPTIIVPGRPPRWTPLPEPRQLPEDSGDYFRDANAAKFPSYPTEPAVRAILTSDPTFPTSTIDIFACGSTLGHLLRYVRNIEGIFRFSVELIGDTVFFVRKENSPRELLENIHGFGHTFPEAYTTWDDDVKGSESHQRIVQYTFGGLRFLVRFESDGYLGSGSSSAPPTVSPTSEDLVQAMGKTSVSQTIDDGNAVLNTITGGGEVQQAFVFDLKTRSGKWKKSFDMANILPQLYVKQIPNFILAYHDGAGLFPKENVEVHNLEKELESWEEKNKEALRRLAILLHKIVKIVKQDKRGLLEIYSKSTSSLQIHSQFGEGSHALPPLLREEWEGFYDSDEDTRASGTAQPFRTDNDKTLPDDSGSDLDDSSDEEKELDFTACSQDTCGYCGRCSY